MAYAHIENLYKNQNILLFRRCWALEKVHGTSAHIHYCAGVSPALSFFSGGESHDSFVKLFDAETLTALVAALGHYRVTIYGEAYGGRCMGMRATYGDELRFIAFDVWISSGGMSRGGAPDARASARASGSGSPPSSSPSSIPVPIPVPVPGGSGGSAPGCWLSVPDAAQLVADVGLEFVPFVKVSTDLAELDRERDAPSEVARRRGCGDGKAREGVILRPPIEVTLNGGHRIVAKHKREAFSERATPQKIIDPAKLAVLAQATEIAQEWVTPMRLTHVLDKLPRPLDVGATAQVIAAMVSDVYREAAGEVVESKDATTAMGRRTSLLFRNWLQAQVTDDQG